MPEPWKIVRSRITYEDRWLRVRSDDCETVDGRLIAPFHVLEYPDWLNVVALTDDREIVLVREYRHGAGLVMTGLPSGTADPDDATPEIGARRELREETGYTGGRFIPLGAAYANPANQGNKVHAFLAVGVAETDLQYLDPSEDIEVLRADFLDIFRQVSRGELTMQAAHLTAIFQAAHAILDSQDSELATLRRALRDGLPR